jgi:hypothetical protein
MKKQRLNIDYAQMRRAAGYGQYKIVVAYTYEDQSHEYSYHSTDSELFDWQNDETDLEKITNTVLSAVGGRRRVKADIKNYID